MKTALLFLSVFISVSLFGQRAVYLCQGDYSNKFHSSSNCTGLNNCKTNLLRVSVSQAQYTYRREYCCVCWDIDCPENQMSNSFKRNSNQNTFTPDYEFYNNSLNSSQSKRDANREKINEAYGYLLNFQCCINKQNKLLFEKEKSRVVKTIETKARGTDWSIGANVKNWLDFIYAPTRIPSIISDKELFSYIVNLPEGAVDVNAIMDVLETCDPQQISKITINNYNQIKNQVVHREVKKTADKPKVNLKPGKIIFYSQKSKYNLYSGSSFLGIVSPGNPLALTKNIHQNKSYRYTAQKVSKAGKIIKSTMLPVQVRNLTNVFIKNNGAEYSYQ
jgi:hypothetical protein